MTTVPPRGNPGYRPAVPVDGQVPVPIRYSSPPVRYPQPPPPAGRPVPHPGGVGPARPGLPPLPPPPPGAPDSRAAAPAPLAPRLPLYRNRDDAWIGGVASGIAHHLGWPVWLIRLCLVGLTLSSVITVAIYGVLWMVMPDAPTESQPPGLQAASHQGMREATPEPKLRSNAGRITAVLMIGLGALLLGQSIGLGFSSGFFWPSMLAVGVALVWVQADVPDEKVKREPDVPQWVAPLLGTKKWAATLRVVMGMGLVGAALSMTAAAQIGVGQIPVVLWVAGLTLAGVGVVAAPWILRFRRKLDAAREEKLIADTRADMAAHLHDSVLQTLALIQRQADDPRQVASLARRQERELRTWLYADEAGLGTLKAALVDAGGEVEDERGVPVEVVCVGDIDLTPDLRAMVQAAREAMMNAAKHSQADLIDVYAEVDRDEEPPLVQVFVRDRGRGFNLDEIADDRMGVRGSIIGRMERHGGTAKLRSAPGEGTEIRLEMRA